jgi:hypothetical protein
MDGESTRLILAWREARIGEHDVGAPCNGSRAPNSSAPSPVIEGDNASRTTVGPKRSKAERLRLAGPRLVCRSVSHPHRASQQATADCRLRDWIRNEQEPTLPRWWHVLISGKGLSACHEHAADEQTPGEVLRFAPGLAYRI